MRWTIDDKVFMTRAWELALKGKGKTSPNPMVGAVVVRGNKIVGEGWHKKCGGPHAEIFALQQAGQRAKGATLYVTLEPCAHFGRTPPCVDKIIASGVKEVVIGIKDPNPLMNGKSIKKLQRAGIKIRVGLLAEDLQRMNESFLKYITIRRPFVVAKIAQTLDGKIATATGESQWITSAPAREFTHHLRNEFDAILVGINTVLKDDPRLNAPSKRLKKIIVDSQLRLPVKAKLLAGVKPGDCIVAATAKSNLSKRKRLERKGIAVLVCPQKAGKVDLSYLLKELAKQEITSVLIEGGAQVIGNALKAKVVDKLHVLIAPKIMGDQRALTSVQGLNIQRLQDVVRLKNTTLTFLGEDILIDGYVVY